MATSLWMRQAALRRSRPATRLAVEREFRLDEPAYVHLTFDVIASSTAGADDVLVLYSVERSGAVDELLSIRGDEVQTLSPRSVNLALVTGNIWALGFEAASGCRPATSHFPLTTSR